MGPGVNFDKTFFSSVGNAVQTTRRIFGKKMPFAWYYNVAEVLKCTTEYIPYSYTKLVSKQKELLLLLHSF